MREREREREVFHNICCNIFINVTFLKKIVGQEVTDQWYSEIKLYRFGGEPRNLSAGKQQK